MTPRTQTTPTTHHQPITLPQDGMSRLSQLLPFLPIGKSTVWAWVRAGKFPQPIKLSDNVTVWRNSDIHDWLNNANYHQGGNHEPLQTNLSSPNDRARD